MRQMGLARFLSSVPFWEHILADPKYCLLPGQEEVMHEIREGSGGTSSQEQERWTHWCSVTAPTEVNHCRFHMSCSLSQIYITPFFISTQEHTWTCGLVWIYGCIVLIGFSVGDVSTFDELYDHAACCITSTACCRAPSHFNPEYQTIRYPEGVYVWTWMFAFFSCD